MKRDLSAEARSAKVDPLDQAIDHVAARLTRVEQNDALASQIINALPGRITWFGWLFHSWAPRLAMIAIAVAAGIVWGNRREVITPSASPLVISQPITAPTALVASVREAEPNRTRPLEHLEPLEPVEPARSDFERSLDAIAAPAALALRSLAPESLPASENLVLEPLAIADLLLTDDSNPPR